MMEKISTNHIVKIGIVVDDIEKAAEYYAELFKIDKPFIRVPDPNKAPDPKAYKWYKGEYRSFRIKTAVVKLEPIYIELVEPIDDNSPWADFKKKHGSGVQFMAFNIDGFEEHLNLMEHKGMPAFLKEEKGKERYAYFDTAALLGVTLEFKEIDKDK